MWIVVFVAVAHHMGSVPPEIEPPKAKQVVKNLVPLHSRPMLIDLKDSRLRANGREYVTIYYR